MKIKNKMIVYIYPSTGLGVANQVFFKDYEEDYTFYEILNILAENHNKNNKDEKSNIKSDEITILNIIDFK